MDKGVMKLPLALRQALESGDCVLFLGAGIGHHLFKDGKKAPDGAQLAADISKEFGLNPAPLDLPRAAQLAEIRKSRADLDLFVKKALADFEPDEHVRWLTTFRWRAVFTTNYDRGFERAYDLNPNCAQTPVPISATADMVYTDNRISVPIFHLHGTPFGPSTSPIVITQSDYAKYSDNRKMVWNRLKNEFATSTFLYIGYSSRDPNWQFVYEDVKKEFFMTDMPLSFRVDPFADPVDVEILKAQNLETLICTLPEFEASVQVELGDFRPDADLLTKFKAKVPAHLVEGFQKNPAMVLRLLDSWEYVNAANFSETANLDSFLKGDRPNWGLIQANRKFYRDVEAIIWDRVIDFATAPSAKSKALLLTAPAGYGITTVLMSLAVAMVKDQIGPVFKLREGCEILEADVAFAATLFPKVPIYFIVDQAREQSNSLTVALAQQRQTKSNCLFIAGERRNEWRMTRSRLKAEEFSILPLSDGEINAMLDFLASEGALGALEHLDRDFQFRVVKDKHEKELLVAMREATAGEGVGFDAIIENEYRGVEDSDPATGFTARELYLFVCCFYQHGVLVRDKLVQEVLAKPIEHLYEATKSSLEGLIDVQESDIARGEFALRARHRTIAEIVWKKCGSQDRREALLQSAMEKINLSYRLDKIAFEKFIRDDQIVETFRTLEGKCNFFETAARRAPNDPYVLQHYARMLLREKQLKLALAEIEDAISKDKDKNIRYFRHTKGSVLAALATTEPNLDIGRKWLAQSERDFNLCIAADDKDEYGHHGLAMLYISWAKHVGGAEEATDYLTKAEKVISDGLGKVRNRESLLIASSEIEKFLGNSPERLSKLQQAVASNHSNVVGRYLLGRAYRSLGQPQKSIEVLDPVVRKEFGEVRAFIEYVRALIATGADYKRCVSVLSLCKLDGINDPVFVGLYGGLLFMDEKYEEAAQMWNESIEKGFSYEERYKTQFRPRDPTDATKPLRLEGTVSKVMPGYVIVETSKTPSFISTRTMTAGRFLQKGMRVTFEPTFSAKGSYADNLKLFVTLHAS